MVKEKELGKNYGLSNNRNKNSSGNDEDEFDRLVRQQKEKEDVKRAAATEVINDSAILAKVAELESSQRNYSDIDLIYEKKRNAAREENLNDEQMDRYFTSLMEEEEQRQRSRPVHAQQQFQQIQPSAQKLTPQ